MNEQQKQRIRNDNLRYLDIFKLIGGESKKGIIRINVNNSIEHERKKFELAYDLKSQGHHFITEAPFKLPRSGRCDLIDLDDGTVYEIVKTESTESILQKQRKYPSGLKIVVINI